MPNVPNVGNLVGKFHEFRLRRNVCGMFHLQFFSAGLGQGLVVSDLGNHAGYIGSKPGRQLCRSHVAIFDGVVQ